MEIGWHGVPVTMMNLVWAEKFKSCMQKYFQVCFRDGRTDFGRKSTKSWICSIWNTSPICMGILWFYLHRWKRTRGSCLLNAHNYPIVISQLLIMCVGCQVNYSIFQYIEKLFCAELISIPSIKFTIKKFRPGLIMEIQLADNLLAWTHRYNIFVTPD